MRTLAISHQRDAGPGVFATAIAAAGDTLDVWHLAETDRPPADPLTYGAVISFGGAMHADQGGDHAWIAAEKQLLGRLLDRGVPTLGVCLGAQLLVEAGGGLARRAREPEIGWHRVELTAAGRADPLLGALAPGFDAFQWHSYECVAPSGASILATSQVCAQAFRIGETAWGIQFHAEVCATDAARWTDDYTSDPDAVRIGIDPRRLHTETAPRIEAWNELGRAICGRFLEAARKRARRPG